jgi:hypothetical protein
MASSASGGMDARMSSMCERGEPWKSYWYYIRMILIGRYDSPYVRRVGVSLHALAIPFELLPLSPFSQASQLRQFSPIGRMPALILMSDEVLIESAAILDYLDDIVGPSRALLPVRESRAASVSGSWPRQRPLVTRLLRSVMSGDGRARGYSSTGSLVAGPNSMPYWPSSTALNARRGRSMTD